MRPAAPSFISTALTVHVALNCRGYDETIARLNARRLDYRLNLVQAIGLRQVFTQDPNGVLLELNFFAD